MNNTTNWIQSGNVSHTETTVCGLVMLCVFICSVILTTSVLWALWKSSQLQTPVYRVVGYLLLDEVLVRVFGSPMIVPSMLTGRWLYGEFGCVFYAFWMTWFGVTATSLFTYVAIERYIIMCRIDIINRMTKKAVDGFCLLCYLHGLVWACLPLLGVNSYVLEPPGVSCAPDWSHDNVGYILGLFSVCFLMPVVVSIVCYSAIFRMVRRSRQSSTTLRNHSVDKNVALTLIATLSAFLLAWTPYSIIGLNGALGFTEQLQIETKLTLIPLVTAKSAGLCYPIIFCFNNREVRDVLAQTLQGMREGFVRFVGRSRNQVNPANEIPMQTRSSNLHHGSDNGQNHVCTIQIFPQSTPSDRLQPREATTGGRLFIASNHSAHDTHIT